MSPWLVAPPGKPWARSSAPNVIDRLAENTRRGRAYALQHPGFTARTRLKKLADWATPLSFFVRHYALERYHGSLAEPAVRRVLIVGAVVLPLLVLAGAIPGFCWSLRVAGGRVIVQTFMPWDPSIQAAARHDYEGFAARELPLRRELGYPPYGRMVRVICRGRRRERVESYTAQLGAALHRLCEQQEHGSRVLGPAPAPVSQIKGRHRFHLLVKCPDSRSVRQILEQAAGMLKGPSGVKVVVDVDPVSML